MDYEQERQLRRWLDAERGDREDDADAACRAVFRGLPPEHPGSGLAGRVLPAVSRRARRRSLSWPGWGARAALAAGTLTGVGAAVAGLLVFAPMLTRQVVGAIAWSAQALVMLLFAMEEGLDAGALLVRTGEATRTALATREVTLVLLAVQAIAVLALFALHRLLASEKEST